MSLQYYIDDLEGPLYTYFICELVVDQTERSLAECGGLVVPINHPFPVLPTPKVRALGPFAVSFPVSFLAFNRLSVVSCRLTAHIRPLKQIEAYLEFGEHHHTDVAVVVGSSHDGRDDKACKQRQQSHGDAFVYGAAPETKTVDITGTTYIAAAQLEANPKCAPFYTATWSSGRLPCNKH